MSRGHLPYRGDGFPTDFESRKKRVNLRNLRLSLAKTIIAIILILVAITLVVLKLTPNPYPSSNPSPNINSICIVQLAIMWICGFILMGGILRLNKFRKDRDVDISKLEQEESDDKNKE
jgi:hypothetical protein